MIRARVDETHDPKRRSWVADANGHAEFPIQNLPLGIFDPGEGPRAGTAIGGHIFDLRAAAAHGLLPDKASAALTGATLNDLLALPASEREALRRTLSTLLADEAHRGHIEIMLHPASACVMHLPAAIGDYTDFYAGIHHARNIGRLFRPDNPLLPNYKHVPIGYHGRASSVRVSGRPVVRPHGQQKSTGDNSPVFAPSRRLDYELELGIWVGEGNALGTPIPAGDAHAHVAGLCLLNDWSARDLQAWEYQPLGPFLAKNFLTTISPWIVTSEALLPFRHPQPARPAGDPAPLPYLWDDADQRLGAYALDLDVYLRTSQMRSANQEAVRLSRAAASNMYWTAAQLVTHHASNGCNLRPGDLLGTGTISAPTADGYGSLMELTEGGARPLSLPSGEHRTALEDGDEVSFSAKARAEGFVTIGFGPCSGIIRAAQ